MGEETTTTPQPNVVLATMPIWAMYIMVAALIYLVYVNSKK